MSLMSLKRFQNELIIFLLLLFVGFSFFYKFSAEKSVASKKIEIQESVREISKVAELKIFWDKKKVKKEITKFKTMVSKAKVKRFEKRSGKLVAIYKNLSLKELNKISKKLVATHFKISKLNIQESGKDRYDMEFTCKW
jgi:hypothetical protein